MANLTKKMIEQLTEMQDAAQGGLPDHLKDFIEISVEAFIQRAARYHTLYKRAQLQSYIDTLNDLISTKVNSR